MASRGRGALLKKRLEEAQALQAQTNEPVHSPPETKEKQADEVPVKRSMGRGAQFAQLMLLRKESAPDGSESSTSSISKDTRPPCHSTSSSEDASGRSSPVSSVSSGLTKISLQDTAPIIMKGSSGQEANFNMNYIRLHLEHGKGVFEYEVKFNPNLEAKKFRFQCLKQHSDLIGETKTFDGCILHLPFQLNDPVTILKSKLPSDESEVELKIIFKRKKFLGECIQLYNILFRQIMNTLGLVLMGRNFFDPSAGKPIPQHRLEVWPGFVTAIDEYEDGIMLCCDASHRVLRTQTVLEQMSDSRSVMSHADWVKEVETLVIGKSVLTKYNNKVYRVDDIDWNSNPSSTFQYFDGTNVSYVDYYSKVYGIKLKTNDQPLLICRKKTRIKGVDSILLVNLIPELCYICGLTDDVRSDMRIMKDVAQFTRINPNQRHLVLQTFINRVNSNETTTKILSSWGLSLDSGTVGIPGRILKPETIFHGCNRKTECSADWSRGATNNPVISPANLQNWAILYPQREHKAIQQFIEMLIKCASQLGMRVNEPEYVALKYDRVETYVEMLKKNKDAQLVCVILLQQRADKYSAIKRVCCVESPIPSQVVLARTIKKFDKLRSVSQKIALQINCKLGGTLWAVKMPLRNTMCCGIDTYHDPLRAKNSISAIVCSTNEDFTRWYSKISKQDVGSELAKGLITGFVAGLVNYKKINGNLPEQVLFYRDGVGDGDLKFSRDFELPQLKQACKLISHDYSPKFLFVVVGKRIHTRMFLNVKANMFDNPPAGSVIDHTVTRRNWYDFFLVSQSIKIGTATPTHYVVLHNTTSLTPDRVQILTYKLSHLYYNWPGPVRVPAPCQYAHKLAHLVGEYIHLEPHDDLLDKLFFL